MTDPDLLAIQRRRRQEARCLSCGTPTPRASLCKTCRLTRCYCPRCEAVYPVELASQKQRHGGKCAIYCRPCGNRVRNGDRRTREAYLAETRENPRLKQIITLYRAGLTYDALAPAVGLSRGGLSSLISYARKTGRWPEKLKRNNRWPLNHERQR